MRLLPRHAPPRRAAALLSSSLLLAGCLAASPAPPSPGGGRPLTFEDLMRFRQIRGTQISDDGSWIGYALVPDRGDGEAVFRSVAGAAEHRVERGSGPRVSADGRWGVARIEPSFEEREAARKEEKKGDDAPRPGLAIVSLEDGGQVRVDEVESFALSDDGRWLAYRRHRSKEKAHDEEEPAAEPSGEAAPEPAEEAPREGGPEEAEEEEEDLEDPELGSTLHLRHLASGAERTWPDVRHYAFDDPSTVLVFDVSAPEGAGNGLFALDLEESEAEPRALHEGELAVYSHPTWAEERTRLAFLAATFDREEGEPGEAELLLWDGAGEARALVRPGDAPEGYGLPAKNELTFSRDGERLFFGWKPEDDGAGDGDPAAADAEGADPEAAPDPFDREAILADRGVDVWHWDDPWINTHQKERWEDSEKDRVHLAVAHLAEGRLVLLADEDMPGLRPSDNPLAAVGTSDVPYRKEVTWDGSYVDLYLVDLGSGERRLVRERLSGGSAGGARLSPSGRYLTFYDAGAWHLHDRRSGETRDLTSGLDVPFADEDHDYPSAPPGYGQAEWLADDGAALIYDKYDVWQVPVDGRAPLRLTQGREREVVHRIVDRDPDSDTLEPGSEVLLRAYDDRQKHDAFVAATLGEPGTRELYAPGAHRLRFVVQAQEAPTALLTRERYDEFPDLWATDFSSEPRRLTDANPQRDELAWGSAELVEWRSLDGEPLQGVLIKPGNYEEGRRYPVLVYYYRFFSQRLHEFNEPVVNHRPSFPLYASNGYAVFLPDIRFEVGRPGFSATKCLVPGVQKLVDMGVADPDAIGLHGHSWSGYQTAFVITQTDLFAAAVAGAPVSNMTSAYSGIRWGSGLARQFQYEQSQSRIGGSLWEFPERYIENSPVFFADRIETPLLIQFGDEDGAVPWTQGIELYLACRRLGKECIFLQYRGEPHHLEQYANKLDYSIKMMEFLDHHLKGAEAPAWMTAGVPYRGE